MRKSLVLVLVATAAAFAALLPAGSAEPSTRWSLEARVPAGTLAFVSAEDVGSWTDRMGKTAIGGFFAEPEVKAFLQPMQDWMSPAAGAGQAPGPLAEIPPLVWDVLRQMQGLQGQAALAFLGISDGGQPQIVASLDFGGHASDFVTFLGRLQGEVDPGGEHIRSSQRDGRPWWTMDAGGMTVAATVSDTAFVIGTGEALVTQTLAGGATGTLATSPDFQAIRRRVGGDQPMLLVYANVEAMLARFAGDMGAEGRRMMKALGVDAITSAAYGLSFAGDGFTDSIVVNAKSMDHGLLALYNLEPLGESSFLPYAPAGTFYFAEANLSPEKILATMRAMLQGMGEREAAQLDEGLAHINAQIGVDLEKEVLGGLAPGYGLYAAVPSTGGLYPEVAALLRPKDPGSFEKVMDRVAQGIAGMLNEEGDVVAAPRVLEYRGKRLHLFEMQEADGDDVVPFTPTWAILDGTLVITLVPHAMKEIILRREAGEAGLAASGDFKTVAAQRPAAAGAFGYVDLAGAMGLLYDTGVPLLQTVAKPNVVPLPFRLDWAALPAARTVRPYWRSMGMSVASSPDGISVSMHGPVPLVPGIVAIAGAAGFVMARTVSGSRHMVEIMPEPDSAMGDLDRQLAEVQLEELTRAVEMYVLDKGSPPQDLGQLVEADLLERLPQDPWGRSFRLRATPGAAKSWSVDSAGPDGQFDTEDDVRSSSR